MPRAVDRYTPEAEHDPTRSGTEFHIDKVLSQGEALAKALELAREQAQQALLDFIKGLTGIDLSSVEAFFESLFNGFLDRIGLDLPALAALNPIVLLQKVLAAFEGIDLDAGPGAILQAIANSIGDFITDAIAGIEADVQKVIDTVISALRGVNITGAKIEELFAPLRLLASATADLPHLLQEFEKRFNGLVQAMLAAFGWVFNSDPGQLVEDVRGGFQIPISQNNPAVVDLAGRVAVIENSTIGNTWADEFDRTTLGPNYTVITGGEAIDMSSGDYIVGGPFGRIVIVYSAEKFLTAQCYAQIRLRQLNNGITRLGIMADTSANNYVGIEMNTASGFDYFRIITKVGTTITGRGNQYGAHWNVNDVVGIGFDPETNTYVAYINDVAVCFWQDTVGVVPTGSLNRSQVMELNGDSSHKGAGLDHLRAYDWN